MCADKGIMSKCTTTTTTTTMAINYWPKNMFALCLLLLLLLLDATSNVQAASAKGLHSHSNKAAAAKVNEASSTQQAAAMTYSTTTTAATTTRTITTTASTSSNSNNNSRDNSNKTALSLESKAAAAVGSSNHHNNNNKYEIRGVAGEPNYKSVNLTWEVEFVPSSAAAAVATTASAQVGVTNMSGDVEPPNNFQIFYCELQTFGPQRCRMKLVNGTETQSLVLPDEESAQKAAASEIGQVRHFAAVIANLRMATKYSFHIRPQQQQQQAQLGRATHSRAEATLYDNEIESELQSGRFGGATLVIPTKGFSAQATQCLPHASEIEVETGPYFGGRIVVDGGNCGVKGNPNDAADKYTMRIDHKQCGSMVKPETNTVETFITVQENLGIFTHSTRRFVVVCSYQSGMQTVRASFTVPGKHGGIAEPASDPFVPDSEAWRSGRDMRRMRFVDKSELVLKDSPLNIDDDVAADAESAVVQQIADEPAARSLSDESSPHQQQQTNNSLAAVAVHTAAAAAEEQHLTKYAKLVGGGDSSSSFSAWLDVSKGVKVKSTTAHDDVYALALRYITANMGSVLLTVSISVIIISLFIIVVHRVVQQQQRLRHKSHHHASSAAGTVLVSHLQHKTLPRALQQQHPYQCSL